MDLSSTRSAPEYDLLGRQIGHFRIVDLLGSGAMGAVYVAFDERLERRVAIKSLATGHLDAVSKARFLREARTLSQLKHPNICQIHELLDGPEGQFLVLELIDGRSLNEVITSKPSAGLRMRIAGQLADVLVATHAQGIIHRDLKPANVMVTADGQVKVLDFGIAGRAAIGAADRTVAASDAGSVSSPTEGAYDVTRVGDILGTISYMSPEQAKGELVTTASDLFSYGLILQELFTGERAGFPTLPPAEQLKKAQAGETAPVRGLDPDLTALINRLKDPAAAVRPTALDTVEWLNRIQAAPQLRTRRRLAWGAAVMLAVVAIGMSYQAWRINRQAERITEEAERANREAQSAREVSGFLVNVFQVSDPGQSRGNTVTARELLDKAAKDIEGRLTDQPLIKARLELTLATVYQSLGLFAPAAPLIDHSLDLRRASLAAGDPALAESLHAKGWNEFVTGRLDLAVPPLLEALKIRERAEGPDSAAVAESCDALAVVYQNQGNNDEAERLYGRALTIREKIHPEGDVNTATTLSDLAYLLYKQAKYAEAEPLFRRAIPMIEKARGSNYPGLAITLSQLGGVYRDQGRGDLAVPLFLRAVDIQQRVLGPDHPYLALRLDGLARIYADQRKDAEAEAQLLRAVNIEEKALGPNHPWLAQGLQNLAIVYRDEKKMTEANAAARRALSIYEASRGAESIETADALVVLSEICLLQGKRDEAQPLLARALSIYRKTPTSDAYSRSLYASGLNLAGHADEARGIAAPLRALGFGRKDFLDLCARLGVSSPPGR